MAMSKTTAIREAAKHVSISGRDTSWHIYGPYRCTEPRGPSTELTADSYRKAQIKAAVWKAHVALGLMGRLTKDADHAVDYAAHAAWPATTDVRGLVEIGLKA